MWMRRIDQILVFFVRFYWDRKDVLEGFRDGFNGIDARFG